MPTDFEQVFEALAGAQVRFVVVGGVAVVLQGHARLTADLDLVVALEPENARRAVTALTAMGYRPRAPVRAEDFADPVVRQSWIEEKGLAVFSLWSDRFPLTEIDLFVAEPYPFGDLWERAAQVQLGQVQVAVASLEHLIAMKSAVGRPKDLQDVIELTRLLEMRRPT